MKTSDFYYDLPKELIAQTPSPIRSQSRLMVYNRQDASISHEVFSDIINHINAGDALVRNTTRVIPARLYGHRREMCIRDRYSALTIEQGGYTGISTNITSSPILVILQYGITSSSSLLINPHILDVYKRQI